MTLYKQMPISAIKFIVVHCAATRPSMDVGAKEIRSWHLQRGFFDIGYHFVIRRDGVIEEGRKLNVPGAHVAGYNGKSWGVCLVGGVTEKNVAIAEDNFTEAQMHSLKTVLTSLKNRAPTARIVGHRDLDKGKACPSFDVPTKLKQIGF